MLVQFFRRYPISIKEREADKEENHSLYREALNAESTIRALSDPPSLGNKCSDTQQLYRRTE
jgi:hypothetical protein